MSSTWLEQTRQVLEQLELIDKSIVTELFVKCDNPKESVIVDHKIKNFIDMKQNKCLDALLLINDADGSKKEEIDILTGQKSVSGSQSYDTWSNFYERIREIKDYHKRYNPPMIAQNSVASLRENIFQPPFREPDFNGEECFGRFVDMNSLYQEFINLKNISSEYKMGDYLWYLQHFDEFHEIPYNLKDKDYKKYKRYLENLVNYLREYFIKSQPLTDFAHVEKQINSDFEKRWAEQTVKGWENTNKENNEDLENNPLFCKSCNKTFSNDHTYVNHLPGKKHKKLEKLMLKNNEVQQDDQNDDDEQNKKQKNDIVKAFQEQKEKEADQQERRKKNIAYLETYSVRLKELLQDVIIDSCNQIRKKQSRTYGELSDDEGPQQDVQDVLSESEEAEPVYNPKNLPLGWDGKPIPYWLYKLHGLGIEYKCEICGNYSYWGRRAFERHFTEWRHSYGMKCLKIPNTQHFREITSINDALAIHQKLLMESELSQFKPDLEEEFEDSDGNLLNRKTYYDLKRQGLL